MFQPVMLGIEHFQGAAAGVDLVVMGEVGEALEDAEQLLVPGAPPDLDVAGAVLRAVRPKRCQLIASLRSRVHGKAAERAHQVLRLALAGLPRVLAEPDAHPFAVLRRGLEQQSFDIAGVGAPTHHVEEPVAAALSSHNPPGLVICGVVRRKNTAVKLVTRRTYRSGSRISPTVLPPPRRAAVNANSCAYVGSVYPSVSRQ